MEEISSIVKVIGIESKEIQCIHLYSHYFVDKRGFDDISRHPCAQNAPIITFLHY